MEKLPLSVYVSLGPQPLVVSTGDTGDSMQVPLYSSLSLLVGGSFTYGSRVYLATITQGRKKDPSYINVSNPIPHIVYRVPNIDPV